MIKNPDDLSINVYKIEEIVLAFQLWLLTYHRYQIVVYTDNIIAIVSLQNSILLGLVNASLCQILLLEMNLNIMIKP